MRPRGLMPDWAANGDKAEPANVAGGIVPYTRSNPEFNWLLAELRKFKAYRDAIENLSFDADESPDGGGWVELGGVVTRTVGRHFAYDRTRQRFMLAARSDSDTAGVGASWSIWGDRPVAGGLSVDSPSPGVLFPDFQIEIGYPTADSLPRYLVWLSLRNASDVIQSTYRVYLHDADDTPPTLIDAWTNISADTTAFARIGGAMWDEEQDRFLVFGTSSNGTPLIHGIRFPYAWEVYVLTDAVPATPLPFLGAVAAGHKLVSNGKTIWRTPNRFTDWKPLVVADRLPGETEILGLFRDDTDGVFVAITASGVWTSPNGVLWAKTAAPAGTYTGAGCAVGGTVVAVYDDGENFRLAVATNALRAWRSLPCPFVRSSLNPVQQVYPGDGRFILLSLDNPLRVATSLRL